jgi:plastocyanin domain-containing protein
MRRAAVFAVLALATGCAPHAPWARAVVAPATSATRLVRLQVTRQGFEPKHIAVRTGEVVTLELTRRVERTCVTSVVVSLDGEARIERELPLDEPVALTLRFEAPGELGMSCPMNMYGATIEVR